ncbi:MAG: hypothetical protein KOO60_11045 [Gemmatimonadales bacterium]|nr:hypothetical protein [Gemmatimonadales bacterium]
MSSDISLTGEDWHGTQMKPDIFEPVTAEWAGRVAKNAGWLFARQQQTIFADGADRSLRYDDQTPLFQVIFNRRFWLNEVVGTFVLSFDLEYYETSPVVVQGTLFMGYGNGWLELGTCEGSYTTEGRKSLTIYLGRDWHKDQNYLVRNKEYGWLQVRCSTDGADPDKYADFKWFSLVGFPRT